ncbi:MAG TPA: phytanoyl-CoA dioxygenase family protein [Polyangiaceae bacterium]|jgi:hypothetical protein|nr:phytanoyl-CoA dioxygenase family protein [Polyangiaceae bacterium]
MLDTRRFSRDGYLVVPGILDETRVQTLRRDLHQARVRGAAVGGGRVLFDPGASIPAVRALFTDPATLAIAREVVGNLVVDLHQSAAHFGAVNRGWHKDCADYMQGRSDGPDWSDDYRIVHFAWYLQDHARHGGGISFRRGSHRIRNDRDGEAVTPAVRDGDLVLFDLRTTHFGNTIQLRWPRRPVFLDPLWRLPKRWAGLTPWAAASLATRALPAVFMPEHGERRLVLFAMYGADDAHSRRFFAWLRSQPDLAHVLGYDGPTPLT